MDISNNILKTGIHNFDESNDLNINDSDNSEKNDTENKSKPLIKHLVISGGGTTGLSFYSILRDSNKYGFWNIDNIETIYATSIGSVLATIVCLKIEWNIIDGYLIQRPWQDVFNFDIYSVFNIFENKGIFTISVIKELLQPLFLTSDILIDITMEEFYNITKKELHIFVTEVDNFEIVDISYKTHPKWKLLEVIYASCCLPIIFEPFHKDGKSYLDGGIIAPYPLKYCINNNNIKQEEIFGLKKLYNQKDFVLKESSSFFDFFNVLINRVLDKILINENIKIDNEIVIIDDPVSIQDILQVASSIDKRKELIQKGSNKFENFIK